ncbi:MAG: NAD(P)H-dependent oxidoreductase [Bacteroidales bacterium]|nr:NAD(P)H-dependent oxidoreductase [Bacteroidales bacterium]
MKLVVINGSPRNKKSNSGLLMDEFLKGFYTIEKEAADICYLAGEKQRIEAVKAFRENNYILMIFPLYTDAMPGIVKEFFEKIYSEPSRAGKRIGYIVQSGFPEAKHSTFLERYLERFTIKRLKAEYLGTVIKGGVEGIQIMPPRMNAKLFASFRKLGEHFAGTGTFSRSIMEKLRKPYTLSAGRLLFFRLMSITGITNYYWNSNLRKNKAFDRRFDKPYMVEELSG